MTQILQILLFGPARDALGGKDSISISIDSLPTKISSVRDAVADQHPNLRFVLRNSIFAVENKLCPRSSEASRDVSGVSEVVLVPPVSGG